jgi:hypothetical protein
MEQSPSSEANGRSADYKIPCPLGNVYYPHTKSTPLVHILRQINPVHNLKSYFFYSYIIPNIVVERVAFLLRVKNILVSNTDPETCSPDRGSPQFLLANPGRVFQITQRLIPSIFFPIHQ